MNDTDGEAASLNSIAIFYGDMGDREKQMEYYLKSLQLYEKNKNYERISVLLTNIGTLYVRDNKPDIGMDYFQQANKLLEKGKNYSLLSNNDIQIAELYFSKNENQQALNYFMKGKSYALKTEAQQQKRLRDIYKGMSDIYERLNNHKNAFAFYRQYIAFRDSLLNSETTTRIFEMEKKYDNEKKLQKMLNLSTEKKQKEQQFQEQRKWMFFWLVGFGLVLIISLFFYFQNRSLQFANNLLVIKNLEIIASEKKLKIQTSLLPETASVEILGDAVIPKTGKYSGSLLSVKQKEELLHKIISLMEIEKAYTQNDITVNKLAENLGTNKSYISQVINEKFDKNFNNFINEYRIKEALSLLSDKKNHNLTIETIAHNVGFNSISAFNNAFKKHTGVTPSFFLKSVKRIST